MTKVNHSLESARATAISNQGSPSMASTNLDIRAMEAENAGLHRELAIKNEEIAQLRDIAAPHSGNRFELVINMVKHHEQEMKEYGEQCKQAIKGWQRRVQELETSIGEYKANEANIQEKIIRRDDAIARQQHTINDRDDLVSWQRQEILKPTNLLGHSWAERQPRRGRASR